MRPGEEVPGTHRSDAHSANFEAANAGEMSATLSETVPDSHGRECRICQDSEGDASDFLSPCLCKGSGRWVHRKCLQEWRVKSSRADSYHTCELCQYQYKVTCAPWARALNHEAVQIVLTGLLLVAVITTGTLVWEALARAFVSLCNYETFDAFRFKVVVLGHDLGWMFGGVIMAKTVVVVCQLCRSESPEVQNMVGFLAFIVYLVQSRVFSPVLEAQPGPDPPRSLDDILDIRMLQRCAPHYFLAVYSATTARWCFAAIRQAGARALKVATLVESRSVTE